MKREKKPKPKWERLKPISLYPLKPEDALRAFMQVNPDGIVKRRGGKKSDETGG